MTPYPALRSLGGRFFLGQCCRRRPFRTIVAIRYPAPTFPVE